MSSTYNGNSAGPIHTAITIPSDGDAVVAASVNTAIQPMVDNDAFLSASKVAKSGDTMTGLLTVSNGAGTSIQTSGSFAPAGDVQLGSAFAINVTNATFATPIVVTLASAPSTVLYDGAEVFIAGVGGNTAANGRWVIKQTGHAAGSFELVGSAGNGAYTSGGIATHDAQITSPTPRTVDRVLTRVNYEQNSGATRTWSTSNGGDGALTAINGNVNQASVLTWDISAAEAPQGASLNNATIEFRPPSGHASVPTVPTMNVYKRSVAFGASSFTLLATGTAAAAGSTGAYEVDQTMTATLATPEIFDFGRFRYLVSFFSENGGGATQGTVVYGAKANFTTTAFMQF